MIKGIILDVDGVLVGGKQGYNWPNPHSDVISTLKKLREKGIVISLCTGKGTFAIKKIVKEAHLNNIHIGDGGAVVVDFLNNKVIMKHTIEKKLAIKIIEDLQQNNIYLEVYTVDNYYIEKEKINENLKNIHAAILYRQPIITESFKKLIKNFNVVKIMPIPKNSIQKQSVIDIYDSYKNLLSLQWGVHPTALPANFGLITKKGISKRQAAITISKAVNISLKNFLGVGDGLTDWNFMEICGYAGAMGNASQELKDLVKARNKSGFIGPTVDENGILEIFNHFGL